MRERAPAQDPVLGYRKVRSNTSEEHALEVGRGGVRKVTSCDSPKNRQGGLLLFLFCVPIFLCLIFRLSASSLFRPFLAKSNASIVLDHKVTCTRNKVERVKLERVLPPTHFELIVRLGLLVAMHLGQKRSAIFAVKGGHSLRSYVYTIVFGAEPIDVLLLGEHVSRVVLELQHSKAGSAWLGVVACRLGDPCACIHRALGGDVWPARHDSFLCVSPRPVAILLSPSCGPSYL